MNVSLVNALAKHLKLDDAAASDALQSVAAEIRRALDESSRVEIPAVGVFFKRNGGIGFEPDAALLRAANLDTEGLPTVSLPGRTESAPAAPVTHPDEAREESPSEVEASLPEDLAEPSEEAPEPELLEADLTGGIDVDDESTDEEAEEVFVELDEKTDPVAYWNEEDLEDEFDDEPEEFEDEDGPVWHGGEEDSPLLGVKPHEGEYQEADFSVIDGDDDADAEGSVVPATDSSEAPVSPSPADEEDETAAAAATAHAAGHREDRPPERHANAHEAREERAPRRKRSLVPIVLIGFVLLLGLGAAAYFLVLRGPEREPIAARESAESPVVDEPATRAGAAGGLVDSAMLPETGAPAETVEEVADPAASVGESPADAGAEARATSEPPLDVSAGGWTVVVGSATDTDEADEIVERFRSLGHDAAVLYGSYAGVSRYRIVVGQFPGESEALAFIRDAPEGFPRDAWRLPITSDLELIPRQD